MKCFFLKNKGQTSIEYMLILAVCIGLGITATKKFREFWIDNPNSIISKQLNLYGQMFTRDPRYRNFKMIR
ncbi:MAG: hypothetical protein AB7I27_00775 [Bacteriovoracaceae bacterium]